MSGAGLPGLTTRVLGRTVISLDEVDSTNRYLKERAGELPHGTACLTGCQRAGRGRLGRSWDVPDGQTLALSVLFRTGGDVERLPLLCGLAVSGALEALTGAAFRIKWPNDIVCSSRKVCGILCESRPDGQGGLAVVAGMGVNLRQTAAWFAQAGLPHAGSVLELTGRTLSLEETAAAILNQLEPLWDLCGQEGFAVLRERYARRCINLGRSVRVLSPDGAVRLEGTAVGVGEDGGLLVESGGEVIPVTAGEATVRGADGHV